MMPESSASPPRASRPRGDSSAGGLPSSVVKDPPHSLELERILLAVLLDGRHATAIHTIREACPHPLYFYVRDHRLVYQACLDIDDVGDRVDASGVAELLRRTGFQSALDRLRQQQIMQDADQLDGLSRAQRRAMYRWRDEDAADEFQDSCLATVGGYATLAEISGHYTTAVGLERNAQLLADYYHKRRLIQLLTRIVDTAHRTTDDFEQLIDRAGGTVLTLSRLGNARGAVVDMSNAVDETIAAIAERNANPESGVLTGFDDVDSMLMALRPGGLYILAARPGVGKTSFALSIVENICANPDERHGALFFSLEVDRVDLVKKLLCARAGISFADMERGQVEGEEFAELERQAEDIRGWALDLMDVSDLTVQGLRSIVKRHMLERGNEAGTGVVVIDYLQLLSSAKSDTTEYEKVSEITRTLKIMAKELRLPVLALSQMNREFERSGGKSREPRLSDLRGSGSIEQDADAVLFLHRVDESEEQAAESGRDVKLVVAKNRFGPLGAVSLKFFPARQRFVVVPKNEWNAAGPAVGETSRGRMDQAPRDDEDLFA